MADLESIASIIKRVICKLRGHDWVPVAYQWQGLNLVRWHCGRCGGNASFYGHAEH